MKVSKEQAGLNRERVVDTAARVFREHGYAGIGVVDLMQAAGLTHGGFYAQFGSKEDLLAEACERAFASSLDGWRQIAGKVSAARPHSALNKISDWYLSPAHRDHPGIGCAVATLGADVARAGAGARQAMSDGVREQIELLVSLMPEQHDARRQAIARYAAMIGAVVLARAVGDAALSDEILDTVAATLKDGGNA